VIAAEGLSRSFGGRQVVRDVRFTVSPGEVVGFLGPNGAGKTTTMRMLLGLLRPSSGRARLAGRAGYLPEQFAAYDALTVEGYLRFCCRMKRLPASAVAPALDAARVAELARRPIGRLSKGQRQRVGLAQAVLGSPPALLLDEPTIGLDPRQVVDARALVRGSADDGAAVLVSTHLLAEAAAMCDRVVVIAAGSVVAEERPGEAADLEDRFLRLVAEAELS
jgi:ABC-2 type transport system ATP-binding protein